MSLSTLSQSVQVDFAIPLAIEHWTQTGKISVVMKYTVTVRDPYYRTSYTRTRTVLP